MAGRQLEKYELLEEVGQGGMAVVYRGRDTSLDREVAIKILHAHLAKEEESKQRFQREAQAVAKLRHDNILEIYDYSGLESPESFIVTEFIHGQTLKAFLARTPISHPEIAVMVVVEVCKALSHAHGFKIIHRDIKPENIMIRDDGRVKLMDFGIAQIVDVQRLTVTGQLLGSPAYMAPELVKGRPLDFRSDVYSAGTLLYQLATSKLPFPGRNPHEVLKKIADGNYLAPEVANPVVDSKLGGIIRKALAHDPAQRYPEIDELRLALLAFLSDVDIDAPRRELSSYFTDTRGYSQQLQTRCVTALVAKGKAFVRDKNYASALQLFDRVLCTDPKNEEVGQLLRQLSRRRTRGRLLMASVGALALLLAGYVAVAHWPAQKPLIAQTDETAPPPDGTKSPVAADAAASMQASAKPDSQVAVDAPAPRRDVVLPKTLRVATRKNGVRKPRLPHLGPARRVEIVPRPKGVTIFLDNRRLGAYGPDLRFITLPRRAVSLKFSNPACCFDKVVRLGATQKVGQLRVRLPWKPGRVLVTLSPMVKANIIVGKVAARAGQMVSVHIPEHVNNGRTQVPLRISARGFSTVSRVLTVVANNTTKVPIQLEAAK